MATTYTTLTRSFLVFVGLLAPFLLESCGFCGPDSGNLCLLSSAPLTKSTVTPAQTVVFEVPGTMVVFHGFACAQSTKSGMKEVLRIDQSIGLPVYATNATVFLNGWEVDYLSGDHHVAGFGTLIDTIRIDPNPQRPTLRWQAAGILSDKNFDDSYKWCYHFTVIAWNATALDLAVDQTDGHCFRPSDMTGNFYSAPNINTTTALASFASFIKNPAFAASKPVSILPRGFGFEWNGCDEDHHILQMAYAMGHPDVVVEAGKSYKKMVSATTPISSTAASQVGTGFVSWETETIFKDNDDRRDYIFGELVSGLGGSDLGVIDPPFSILPFNDDAQGSLSSNGVEMKTYRITNIPYNKAVPVLRGWDLGYLTSDQHIKQAGIWIDSFHYEKNPTQLTGTLTYTVASILRDDDGDPGFYARPKVTVLGFQPTSGKVTIQGK